MYLVAIAWLYVALMMALAEAFHANGTVLGAIMTFLLYGILPVMLVLYLMGSPLRRAHQRRVESIAQATDKTLSSGEPDAGGHATAATEAQGVAPVRKEPG